MLNSTRNNVLLKKNPGENPVLYIPFYCFRTNPIAVENMILVDNGIGIFTLIHGASTIGHVYDTNKYTHVENSLLVGKSKDFDCNVDKFTEHTMTYFKDDPNGRSYRNKFGERKYILL